MVESTTSETEGTSPGVSRRDFLKFTAGAAAVAASSATILGTFPSLTQTPSSLFQTGPASSIEEATIAQLQAQMIAGTLKSLSLVNMYLSRITAIDASGPFLNSILQTNPDATTIASQLDSQRKAGTFLGPLMGIPILLKDNIDTHDKMQSAAGSLALVGTPALKDSTVGANLRKAGAVVLGKTNLSEWANFRSFFSSSGWCGRGGQCNNPYAIDRNPCGSSSGSGAAPSANLTAVSIGTETDGSIVCPANANGVVTVGPHARTVADAATVLTAIAQRTPDPRDPATSTSPLGKLGQPRPTIPEDYTAFLNPNGLRGARIGVSRDFEGFSAHTDAVFEASLTAMEKAGATLVDVFFPHFSDIFSGGAEFTVLLFDFVQD
ncbi:twin-arginine translocation signal domain-containing protein, partial [Candidatus Bathyarchaeota archaeon]